MWSGSWLVAIASGIVGAAAVSAAPRKLLGVHSEWSLSGGSICLFAAGTVLIEFME